MVFRPEAFIDSRRGFVARELVRIGPGLLPNVTIIKSILIIWRDDCYRQAAKFVIRHATVRAEGEVYRGQSWSTPTLRRSLTIRPPGCHLHRSRSRPKCGKIIPAASAPTRCGPWAARPPAFKHLRSLQSALGAFRALQCRDDRAPEPGCIDMAETGLVPRSLDGPALRIGNATLFGQRQPKSMTRRTASCNEASARFLRDQLSGDDLERGAPCGWKTPGTGTNIRPQASVI